MGDFSVCSPIRDNLLRSRCETEEANHEKKFDKSKQQEADYERLKKAYQSLAEKYYVKVRSAGKKNFAISGKVIDNVCSAESKRLRESGVDVDYALSRHLVTVWNEAPIKCTYGGCKAVEGAFLLVATLSDSGGNFKLDLKTDLENIYVSTDNPKCSAMGYTHAGQEISTREGRIIEDIVLTIQPRKI